MRKAIARWANSSSNTLPGIVSVTSRTTHPVRRSNEDDCQLSACAGLSIFNFGSDGGAGSGVVSFKVDAACGATGRRPAGTGGVLAFSSEVSEPIDTALYAGGVSGWKVRFGGWLAGVSACFSFGTSSRYSPIGESAVMRHTRRATISGSFLVAMSSADA